MPAELSAAELELKGYDRVQVLASVDSTNEYSRQILMGDALIRRSFGELSIVTTSDQKAGKGRLDRVWVAPPGATLATSFIVRPHANPTQKVAPEQYHWFTSLAALAGCDTLDRLCQLEPTIKWPNDVLIGNRKVCGVLAQLVIEPEGQISVIVGIGMNLNLTAEQLPVPTATSALLESGIQVNLSHALEMLGQGFEQYYRQFAAAGFNAGLDLGQGSLLEKLKKRMSTLGARLTIHLPGGQTFRGVGIDLTDEGELVVRSSTGLQRTFTVGDVVHVRPRGYGSID